MFGSQGLLQSQATILVTHAMQFLQCMDRVLVLSEGTPVFFGTFSELQQTKGLPPIEAFDHNSSEGGDKNQSLEDDKADPYKDNVGNGNDDEKEEIIMTNEVREHGLSKFRVWLIWFQYAGGWPFLLTQILLLAFDRLMYVGSEWWISQWADASDASVVVFGREFPPQTDGRAAQAQYVLVYYIILALSILGTTLRSHWGSKSDENSRGECSCLGTPYLTKFVI